MRTSAKKRLHFFIAAIIVYVLGFQFIPESLQFDGDLATLFPLIIAGFSYFVFLPVLYWLWVIKAGKQKPWRIILVFSLSSLCARYSFPTDIAQYFEFIMFLRYPLIAILLIVELYLMVTIVKGLWQARKLSGDPRIHVIDKYQGDDKKLALALTFSWEPASWYYAIPKFSKKHIPALGQLVTKSATRWHWLALLLACIIVGSFSYYLLVGWSEIVALFVASFIFYCLISLTANHRVARNYSVYANEECLIINNGFLGFSCIKIDEIENANLGEWQKLANKEQLMFGKGKKANVELVFTSEQFYSGALGQFPEKVSKLWLHVEQPKQFVEEINKLKAAV